MDDDIEGRARAWLVGYWGRDERDSPKEAARSLADLIRKAVLAEREACELAVVRSLVPMGDAPPCDCVTRGSAGGWTHFCRCSNTGDLEIVTDWCSRQNAADQAASAIRARGESDG